jgi:hypothetical protein
MPLRTIEVSLEIAAELRDLDHRAVEAYTTSQDALHEMKKRCAEIAGPIGWGELAALCRDHDRIEVVTRAEYLSEVNQGRWY